jgi:precorrin-3B methylase
VELFRAARSGQTPVGIVTDAGQDGQALVLTDLKHVLEQEIGMRSIVIVGNSATQVIDGRMVTARGYDV